MITMPTPLRRLATVALISTAVGLGGSLYPAIASAEWDIELYDDCMAGNWGSIGYCCEISGGWLDWGPAIPTCRAPAPEAQGSDETSNPRPPKVFVPKVPVQPTMLG